ncbi:MAG TPA: CDP-alcohol phosphatidyltransferase family protein [Acidimicrobiales bacterium]|nr:CDP-alcohol phosphatidyltransferase family protein [Acidimicrobiales bacterium]
MNRSRPFFGPSALLTPANGLTFARLVGAPVLAVMTIDIGPVSWLLWALWTLFCLSDSLDGYIARQHGTTRSGAFLDPLADKFLVLGALSALSAQGVVGILPVAIIGAREIAMSAFRVTAGRQGISVPARPLAKLKTLAQDIAIAGAFFPPIGQSHRGAVAVALWVAVALTLATGFEYFLDARRDLRNRVAQSAVTSSQGA